MYTSKGHHDGDVIVGAVTGSPQGRPSFPEFLAFRPRPRCPLPAGDQPPHRATMGPVTGDAADLIVDPIVNLRDAHLVELYLHRASADRDSHIGTREESPAQVTATNQVEVRRSPNRRP
jgi:hypothetical protein